MSTTGGPASAPSSAPGEVIRIRGARAHNLQHVDLDIPRNQLVVLTGPSGSGKSSLAFDTIFAEGQRQFIESLSVSARQYFDQIERPDVDLVDGLQPTICIDQRPGNQNPRSTVATVTEIYDFLRVLMARLGTPHCHQCELPIRPQSLRQIEERLMELPEGTKTMILAPMIRGRRGQQQEVFAQIRKAGFVRVRVDGEVFELEQVPELSPRKLHHVEAVVDRVVLRPGLKSRLAESLQTAVKLGNGLVIACYFRGEGSSHEAWHDEMFSTLYACPDCQISYEELEPRTFSFNSPYGACAECDGLGVCEGFDPELVLPHLELSLDAGAVAPWKGLSPSVLARQQSRCVRFLESQRVQADTPLCSLSSSQLEKLLWGDETQKFPGVMNLLETEYATSLSELRREQLTAFRGQFPCRVCGGSRLRREANHVRLGGLTIHEITRRSVHDAAEFFRTLSFGPAQQRVAVPLLAEITKRLDFLAKVGVAYLSLNRAASSLSGGELQRVRLATSIGSGLVGVCYILDEPSIGLHPRDNQQLIDALRDLQQQGNSVLVVEHDEAMMRQADWLIDIGPGAGQHGGRVVAQGDPREVSLCPASPTGQYLSGQSTVVIPSTRRKAARSRSIHLEGASANNLQEVSIELPLGCLVCVTGVSGSGKSTLINETLARALVRRLGGLAAKPGPFTSLRGASQIDKVVVVDQTPIGRTPRSNPATYTGVFDEIRKVFAATRDAKQRGYRASRFSFNAKGGR
ncbi:MAG: excinuclease ABC subunit UvrA, partial [Pirellulaceae bacterium]